MATQFNGQAQMGGTVQMPQGGQQAPYGVQMPLGQQFQSQPAQPTGQQTINGNAGVSYDVGHLPPPPQPQQQAPYMGQQGNFGLTPQWGAQVPQGQQPGQGQGQGWQQPQQQMPAQQQPSQQGTPQLGLNTRLDGPAVPPALRGRTLGEALTIYNALEGSWAQRQGVAQTPAQQSLAQMQPQGQPQQPIQRPMQQPHQQANAWTNPEEFFGNLLDQKLDQRLAPITQHTQQQAVTQAYSIAKQGVQDFGQLEPDLMQMLAGADPGQLSNPATWIGAADIVRGRQMREGRYQAPQQPQGAPQVQIPGQQPGGQHPSMMNAQPAGQFGQVPAYGFFTESPSAPSVSQFGAAGSASQPTPQDFQAAEKFRMPIQEYMAWKTGVQINQGMQPAGMGGGR